MAERLKSHVHDNSRRSVNGAVQFAKEKNCNRFVTEISLGAIRWKTRVFDTERRGTRWTRWSRMTDYRRASISWLNLYRYESEQNKRAKKRSIVIQLGAE